MVDPLDEICSQSIVDYEVWLGGDYCLAIYMSHSLTEKLL